MAEQPPSQRSCGCSAALQQPKPNGTCAACGGWLPGEQPAPLPWTFPEPSDPLLAAEYWPDDV